MKNSILVICTIALLFTVTSCEKQDVDPIETRTFQLTVASKKKQNAWHPYADLTWGFSPESFWVKEPGDAQWRAFSTDIEGFEWEEGYEYTLTVKSVVDTRIQDKGADYTLMSVDSRTQKNSAGIPLSKTHEIKDMTVASIQYTPSEDEFPQQWHKDPLFIVKYDYAGLLPGRANISPSVSNWVVFYGEIEDFTYEPGYEYVIDIRYDDATNWRGFEQLPLYRFEELVSKTPVIP